MLCAANSCAGDARGAEQTAVGRAQALELRRDHAPGVVGYPEVDLAQRGC